MTDITALANIKNLLPANFADQLAASLEEQGERFKAAGNRISVTQSKKFRLNGGDDHDTLDFVILEAVYRNEFYDGIKFKKDVTVPPACFAISLNPNGMTPSKDAPKRQADECGTCAMNEWGSDPEGAGKACKNNVVLAVVTADKQDGDIFLLKLSPTAVGPFKKYMNSLTQAKLMLGCNTIP